MLLQATCTQLDNIDLQVFFFLRLYSFWGEAILKQILFKVPCWIMSLFMEMWLFTCIHKNLSSFSTNYNWTDQISNHGHDKTGRFKYMLHPIRCNKSIIKKEGLQNLSRENGLIPFLWIMKSQPHRLHGGKSCPDRMWSLGRKLPKNYEKK